MNFQPHSEKHQHLFQYIIANFGLDELPYSETLGIKGYLFVFADSKLAVTVNLDEDIQKSSNSSNHISQLLELDGEQIVLSKRNNQTDLISTNTVFKEESLARDELEKEEEDTTTEGQTDSWNLVKNEPQTDYSAFPTTMTVESIVHWNKARGGQEESCLLFNEEDLNEDGKTVF